MSGERLTYRALNRATLARQMLLARQPRPITDAVAHLIGLQAQVTEGPYQGLWSRLGGFRHEDLTSLIQDRTLLRATSLRATLHLHTVPDMVGLRPLVQPVLDRMWQAAFGKRIGSADRARVAKLGRRLLDNGPITAGALGKALQPDFPDADPLALSVLLQVRETLIQVPPTRIWGSGHAPLLSRLEAWVPDAARPALDRETLVLRYLAAYGPASIADMQSWSGLTGLKAEFETLRDRLATFTDETGRALFDLPDAPRPGPDTPAPVRLLPLYDNVILGYANRRRMFSEATATRAGMRQDTKAAILIDGAVAAGWKIAVRKGTAAIAIEPYRPLLERELRELLPEAMALLKFMQPDASDWQVTIEEG
jgi:hypothetical protein